MTSSSTIKSRKNITGKKIRENSEILSNLPEALEVYRAAWLILTKKQISV